MKTKKHPYDSLTLNPGFKWFSHKEWNAIDGWKGPFKTIDSAAKSAAEDILEEEEKIVYVTQGRRLTKDEKAVDPTFDWHVETENTLEIRL